jgi:hypothetical protein
VLKKLGSWFQLVLVLKEIENPVPVPVPIPSPIPKTSPHSGSVFNNPNQNRQFQFSKTGYTPMINVICQV